MKLCGRKKKRSCLFVSTLAITVIAAACAKESSPAEVEIYAQAAGYFGSGRMYTLPADSVTALVREFFRTHPLGLSIAADEGERITTTWTMHEGKTSGLLRWQKEWQERVRIEFFIRPSYHDVGQTVLTAAVLKTQERPNEHYPWKDAPVSSKAESLVSSLLDLLDDFILETTGGR